MKYFVVNKENWINKYYCYYFLPTPEINNYDNQKNVTIQNVKITLFQDRPIRPKFLPLDSVYHTSLIISSSFNIVARFSVFLLNLEDLYPFNFSIKCVITASKMQLHRNVFRLLLFIILKQLRLEDNIWITTFSGVW